MIRLKALLVKEFLQMQRDKAVIFMMILIPVVQLLLFGFAINTDVKHLSTIVFDQCLQEESRDLLSSFTASGYFDVKEVANGYQQVNDAVDSGRAKVGVVIPPDFAENLKHGRTAAVQVIVDASDSMTASSAISAAQVIGLELDQHNVTRSVSRLRALATEDPAARRVDFVAGDATRVPLPDASIDTVVSIHAFEHIQPVAPALAELARVLRVGGRAYLRFPPYWSAWGPHLERWIRFPWPHLLFSDQTLIAAVNRIEARKRLNDRYPAFLRLDLRGETSLPHVNKLTLAEFDAIIAALPLRIVSQQLFPVGYKFLPRAATHLGPLGAAPRAADGLLHRLAATTAGREVIATKALVVLERVAEGAA